MKSGPTSQTLTRVAAATFALLLPLPSYSYNFPLSDASIRAAYFLGSKASSLGPAFLADYTHKLPQLKSGACTSEIRLDTPYSEVAAFVSKQTSYSAQDAVKSFHGKPAVVRVHLDLCYQPGPPSNGIKLKFVQDRTAIAWSYESLAAYLPPSDESSRVAIFGERIDLTFPAERISSCDLTISIETPGGSHVRDVFDLATLK
jgi:hypothetical protein